MSDVAVGDWAQLVDIDDSDDGIVGSVDEFVNGLAGLITEDGRLVWKDPNLLVKKSLLLPE